MLDFRGLNAHRHNSSFLDSVSYLFLNMGLITTRGLLFLSLPRLATALAVGMI